ncbi:MAG: MliC family protein [Steroidobacteraceae bacterium]
MTTSPTLPLRLFMVSLAGLALIAAAGCQRKAAPADETAADAPPAATAPAPAPTPAADEVPAGVLRAYVWHCADGQTLVMRNLIREQAIAIDFHDGTRRLDQTASASGARYADGVMVFWTKGSAATLERKGTPAVRCEERRADSLREDARVRGVVYRALGNEPGWTLEVGPASKLSWTTNYGEERHDFEQAEAATAPDGTSVYTAQKDAISIKASIKAERCVDDGDVAYDHVVTVESGGQTYHGCGTRLNAK